MPFSDRDVAGWIDAVDTLHAVTSRSQGDEDIATEAAANLWSGFGYQDAPVNVLLMLSQATQIGYLAALNDLRDGQLGEVVDELDLS